MFNFLFNVHCNRPNTTHSGSSSYFDRALPIGYFGTGREVPAGVELKPGADAPEAKRFYDAERNRTTSFVDGLQWHPGRAPSLEEST